MPRTSMATTPAQSCAPAILQLRNIYKLYGTGAAQVRALDGVDLLVRAGEFVAVMGPSGSGKSTCMNILGCLDVPSAGQYVFRGVDVGALNHDERALLRRHYMGFVFQSYNLLPRVGAVANVELPLVYEGVRRARRREMALDALGVVGLRHRAAATPNQLSGGEQQRVAIARALVSEPSLLLADEPTGNLDTVTAREVMGVLTAIRAARDITIVMVTHEPEIAAYAERVLHFRDGRLVAEGPPEAVPH
jgi:putative ABC transport system ATP-binding protein